MMKQEISSRRLIDGSTKKEGESGRESKDEQLKDQEYGDGREQSYRK